MVQVRKKLIKSSLRGKLSLLEIENLCSNIFDLENAESISLIDFATALSRLKILSKNPCKQIMTDLIMWISFLGIMGSIWNVYTYSTRKDPSFIATNAMFLLNSIVPKITPPRRSVKLPFVKRKSRFEAWFND